MTVIYRRPLQSEAEAMAALHVACWREAYRGIVPDELLDRVDMADRAMRWRGYLSVDDPTFTLAAYADGLLAGFVRSGQIVDRLLPEAGRHIHAIYVLERFQRRGIGRGLMRAALDSARTHGEADVSLGVLTANRKARAFYDAIGGQAEFDTVYNWSGHQLPETIYRFRT